MDNIFRKKWHEVEATRPRPRFLRNIKTIDFEDYRKNVLAQNPDFVDEFVESIYSGDAYIIRNAFTPAFLRDMKKRVFAHGQKAPTSSQQILDGCPDYHESMEHNTLRPNGYVARDHSYYFFRWNMDPLGLFSSFDDLWTVHKIMSGLKPDDYKHNRPLDGAVDRIQVIHYPTGAGQITTHSDPAKHQKAIVGAMMTEPEKDYQDGGFYVLGKDKKPVFFENQIDFGSAVSVYPTMFHGVSVIDPGKTPDWSSSNGRWYFSLFTVDSHHVKNRETALPVPAEYGVTG